MMAVMVVGAGAQCAQSVNYMSTQEQEKAEWGWLALQSAVGGGRRMTQGCRHARSAKQSLGVRAPTSDFNITTNQIKTKQKHFCKTLFVIFDSRFFSFPIILPKEKEKNKKSTIPLVGKPKEDKTTLPHLGCFPWDEPAGSSRVVRNEIK